LLVVIVSYEYIFQKETKKVKDLGWPRVAMALQIKYSSTYVVMKRFVAFFLD